MGFASQILIAILLAVLLLALVGIILQVVGTIRDLRKHPPVGRLVDVGAHRLHAFVQGQGSPPVVFDSALAGSCLSWSLLQEAIAGETTTCSYDRAGMGWSEPGPFPRTLERLTAEFRALLLGLHVPRPWVVVGHSYGTLTALLLASRHPECVAGLVLVDPPSLSQWATPAPDDMRRIKYGARYSRHAAVAAWLGVARFISFLADIGAFRAARFSASLVGPGALRGGIERFLGPWNRLPVQLRRPARNVWLQPKFYRALASQIEHVPAGVKMVAASSFPADLPLIVISATDPSPQRLRNLEAIAARSSRGRVLVASNSGHWVPLEQPEVVIHAIRQVLEMVRNPTSKAQPV